MDNKFIETINYLKGIKEEILKNEEKTIEEKLITIIKEIVLTDNFNRGSIILTKDNIGYKISNIQKCSYVWQFKEQYIDLSKITKELIELKIDHKLIPHPIGKNRNDYELSFEIELTNTLTKRKTRESK